jgi:PAS domain S-box-containing protein
VWWVWWIGDALGVLLGAPFLLAWLTPPRIHRDRPFSAELGALVLALSALCQVVFAGRVVALEHLTRLEYTVFPFIIWAAVRFGQRAATSVALLISGFAIWGAIHDRGPFASGGLDQRLMLLDVFMGIVMTTALTLSAVVAERRTAERALAAARDQLEDRVRERTSELASAQRIARLGSWEWDVRRNVVTWSDELFRIFGHDKATFGASYEAFIDCIHPGDRAHVTTTLKRAHTNGEPFQLLHRAVVRGAIRWIEGRGTVERGPDGKTWRMVGTAQDVTEREQQQEKLRESDAFFELSLDMLSTASLDGYFKRINPAFKVLGWSEQELLSTPFLNLVHPDDVQATLTEVKKLGEGSKTLHFENRYRCKDGSYRWISWVSSPDANGILYGTGRDVTAQKEAQQEHERLNEQLRAQSAHLQTSLREREVLLQEIHHRVKNNLQVISSLINMQIRKLEAGDNRDALEECRARVQAIALIHEKLYQSQDFSRIPFSEYAKSLASSVFQANRATSANVRLDLAIDELALPVDQAIPCGLILNELIGNALKHGFADGRTGTVKVRFERLPAGDLCLSVSNDGVELPDGFQSEASPSLGLNLVSTLSGQLGGRIEVSRRPGTSFRLKFALPD